MSDRAQTTHRPRVRKGQPEPARHVARFRPLRRKWLALGFFLAVLAGIAVVVFIEVDWRKLSEAIDRLNTAAVIGLMATLPLAGFSIGLVYLIAGAKFGPLLGGAVVFGVTAVHLLATHGIARRLLRRRMERFLERRHYRLPLIPEGENASIALMGALMPGLPYFARNYLLALSGVPLRVYFWVCLPVYVARSYLVIFLGDLSSDPSRRWLVILGVVYAIKLAICAYLMVRLRRRYRQHRSAPR